MNAQPNRLEQDLQQQLDQSIKDEFRNVTCLPGKPIFPGQFQAAGNLIVDPFLEYLCNFYIGAKTFEKVYSNIPATKVYDFITNLALPLFGDFQEINNNGAFEKIKTLFFETLFGHDEAFLGYIPEDEEFRVLIKLDKNRFLDVKEAKAYNLLEDLVAGCQGIGIRRRNIFASLYTFGYECCEYESMYHYMKRASMKTIEVTTTAKNVKNQLKYLQGEIERTDALLINASSKINYGSNIYTQEDVSMFGEQYMDWFKEKCNSFGLIRNQDPKKERLITAEAHRDMHDIKCITQMRLEQLRFLADGVKKKFGIDLEFEPIIDIKPQEDMVRFGGGAKGFGQYDPAADKENNESTKK